MLRAHFVFLAGQAVLQPAFCRPILASTLYFLLGLGIGRFSAFCAVPDLIARGVVRPLLMTAAEGAHFIQGWDAVVV